MRISLVVSVYNDQEYLHRSLDSILQQSYRDIELILIDDGSTDNSLEICREYKEKDKRVILINSENQGIGLSRNLGIQRATGDYLSFVEAGDVLREDALFLLFLVTREKEYAVVSSNYYLVKDDIKEAGNYPNTGEISRDENAENTEVLKRYYKFKESKAFAYVWGKLYKTSFIKENDICFNSEQKTFLEDQLFNLKVFSYNPTYYLLNEPLYYYNLKEDWTYDEKDELIFGLVEMLESYEEFLNKEDKYLENLDLFIPLSVEAISASVLQVLENKISLKTAYSTLEIFSQKRTIKKLFNQEGVFKNLWKRRRPFKNLVDSITIILMKYKLEAILAFLFVITYPLTKIRVKR